MASVNSNGQIKVYLVVLGSAAVGKTALTVQFYQNHFVEEYDPTIEDSYTKLCKIDNDNYSLNILDSAGNEDFSAIRDQYIKGSNGFVVAYDITDRQSFQKVVELIELIRAIKDTESFPLVLVGNKCDLASRRQISVNEGTDLAAFYGCPFFETSAKFRINTDETFFQTVREVRKYTLISKLMEKDKKNSLRKNSKKNRLTKSSSVNSVNSVDSYQDYNTNNNNNTDCNINNNQNNNNVHKKEKKKSLKQRICCLFK